MIYRLPIDTKSLYLNIRNDNEAGHTATVATPLKQGNSYREELGKIFDIPENINSASREDLICSILEKSRVDAKIIKVCVFDKISVNGEILGNDKSFCIYVREETSTENVHCGRQKVHYPLSFKFSDNEVEIDNKSVLKFVSEKLNDFAFLVNAFEYDTLSKILNFDVTVVGPENIPYSKVFINQRGAGSKFTTAFFEDVGNYDTEIISLREKLGYENVNPVNYFDIMLANRQKALSIVRQNLIEKGFQNIRIMSEEYPFSLYDIEYTNGQEKNYVIIRITATKLKHFVLPLDKINFVNAFPKKIQLVLVSNILDDVQISTFYSEDLANMQKKICSITYEAKGAIGNE